jgi:hypothetical protein
MRWRRQRDGEETHHTVSADILNSLGKGFLIATAGVIAGALFGTSRIAELGLWTVGVAVAAGIGCVIGGAIVRNLGCRDHGAEEEEHRQLAETMALATAIEAETAPEREQIGHVARLQCERERKVELERQV